MRENGQRRRGNGKDDEVGRMKQKSVCKTSLLAQSVGTVRLCLAFITYSSGFNGVSG